MVAIAIGRRDVVPGAQSGGRLYPHPPHPRTDRPQHIPPPLISPTTCRYTASTRFDKAHGKIFAGKSLQQEKKEKDERTKKSGDLPRHASDPTNPTRMSRSISRLPLLSHLAHTPLR